MNRRWFAYLYGLIVWLGLFLLLHFTLPFAPVRFWNRLTEAWRVFIELNIATFLLFGADKLSAQVRIRRMPERVLYLATLLGGSVGALVAMNLFRHKTSKTGFQIVIALLILVQVLIVIYWL